MLKRITRIFPVFLLFTVVACTANYNLVMKKSEDKFYRGQYKEAARELIPQINKSGKDQLLFLMECGLMLQAAQDYQKSNEVFLKAGKMAEQINKSISKQAASLLLNETTTNYNGEDFERVLIHVYTGINFLLLNKPDSAQVEFKKVNNVLRDINVSGGKAYKQNIMAKYLTGIAFEMVADLQNDAHDREFAYVEYKQIYELNPKLRMVYRDLQRLAKQLGDDEDYRKWRSRFGKKDNLPKDAGELVMIYHAGLSAVKVSRGPLLADKAMEAGIRVALSGMPAKEGVTISAVLFALNKAENPIPRFQKRSNRIDHLVINVNGKDVGRTVKLEDIESTAVRTLDEKYNTIVAKTAAGIAVKVAASIAAGYAAKKAAEQVKQLGSFAGLIGTAVGAGTGAALISQIKPDLRCWHTLPANLQLSRIFLPPGQYDITIKFIDKSNRVERTTNHKINIVKGKKTIFNFRTLY